MNKMVTLEPITAETVEALFLNEKNEDHKNLLTRFFKTGKGEYGEGDEFLGLKVPQTRNLVKELKLAVPKEEIAKLLYSKWHEVRLCGFLLLIEEMKVNLPKKSDLKNNFKKSSTGVDCVVKSAFFSDRSFKEENSVSEVKTKMRKEIAEFYLSHARQANNWDLVDLSCQFILGPYIRLSESPDYALLYNLAESENLWEQRIAVVTTLDFIRNGIYEPTFHIIEQLISHPHDLIHKAMGWVLREIGKRDKEVLTDFLQQHVNRLPRTTLRYAIERFPAPERLLWLKK